MSKTSSFQRLRYKIFIVVFVVRDSKLLLFRFVHVFKNDFYGEVFNLKPSQCEKVT